MNDDAADLGFENRNAFRTWLERNHDISCGIWIVFEKGIGGFSANDALEEAICFGWIDGIMKSIDEHRYKKYFSRRKDKANWSKKNKSIFKKLAEEGLITEFGVEAFKPEPDQGEIADKADQNAVNIRTLKETLRNDQVVAELFESMPPSRKRQLAGFYGEAKTEATREKRKAKIIEALTTKYKGMLY